MHLPTATQVVDHYHAREHLLDLARLVQLLLEDTLAWGQVMEQTCYDGDIDIVAETVDRLDLSGQTDEAIPQYHTEPASSGRGTPTR